MSDTGVNAGKSGPFDIAPSGPLAWSLMPATVQGQQVIVLYLATPHVAANFWFNIEEFDKLLEGGRATRLGLIIPNGQH